MDNEIHCLEADRGIQSFVVGGVLVQIAADDPGSDVEDSSRTDGNVLEANEIVDLGTGPTCTLDPGTPCRTNAQCVGKGTCLLKQNSGIAFNSLASTTLAMGNHLSGRMDRGISVGGASAVISIPDWYPGTCAGAPDRICVSGADCYIGGYDTADRGPCEGVRPRIVNGNSTDVAAEGNVLDGVFDTAALFANNTDTFAIAGNDVHGGTSGIRLNATAIHGRVERNRVSGAADALYLGFRSPSSNGIRWNDFTEYGRAIRTSNDLRTLTDIGADGGNYWGLACPGFDRSLVVFDDGTVNPFVFDGSPYASSVAGTPQDLLPAPCP